MPWWSWILLWTALVSLSLLFFVVLGVRLFRQIMTTLKELGEAEERFSHPGSVPAIEATLPAGPTAGAGPTPGAGPAAGAGPDVTDPDVTDPEPGAAVFASPEQMRHDYRASKQARQESRRLRRINRKLSRGQPQSLRDLDFS